MEFWVHHSAWRAEVLATDWWLWLLYCLYFVVAFVLHVKALTEHCWCKWSLWFWTLMLVVSFHQPLAGACPVSLGCVQVFVGHHEYISMRGTWLQCDDQHLSCLDLCSVVPGAKSICRGSVEGSTVKMAKLILNFLPYDKSVCHLIYLLALDMIQQSSVFQGYQHQKAIYSILSTQGLNVSFSTTGNSD